MQISLLRACLKTEGVPGGHPWNLVMIVMRGAAPALVHGIIEDGLARGTVSRTEDDGGVVREEKKETVVDQALHIATIGMILTSQKSDGQATP